MKTDRKIEINITEGRLESFTVEVTDELPSIRATLGLYTDIGEKITTFSVSSQKYYGDKQLDLPFGTIPAIQKIIIELEQAVLLKCRERQLLLTDNNL